MNSKSTLWQASPPLVLLFHRLAGLELSLLSSSRASHPTMADSEIDVGYVVTTGTAQLITMAVAWGTYTLLFIVSVFFVVRKGIRGSTPRQVLLFATCLMFSASTALAGVDTAIYLVQFSSGEYLTATTKLQLACEVLFDSLFLMGDTIVIWRTWAICASANRKYLVASPMTVWFGGFICLFSLICVAAQNGASSAWAVGVYDTPTTLHLSMATAGMSAGTNLLCTTLISVRAWGSRDLFKRPMASTASNASGGPGSRVNKIMTLLVESGFIYLTIWIIAMLNFYLDWKAPALQAMLRGGVDMVMGLYPTVIIILVHVDYTVWGSPSSRGAGVESGFSKISTTGSLTRVGVSTFSAGSQTDSDQEKELQKHAYAYPRPPVYPIYHGQ
ncbi:hypothetical protein MKEN_01301100 [Mycena kentingensis (nom. inval.)]|nr:hypothetical protein MKEN_01301100 [Mycena kentingensis (nom. inval.)]